MTRPAYILSVRFRSPLSLDEIMAIAHERAPEFRALPGLLQKYYVQDAESGEYGGVYLWESQEALAEYRASELRASIAAAYQAEGDPSITVSRVIEVLRD